jgi:hypothetical protein
VFGILNKNFISLRALKLIYYNYKNNNFTFYNWTNQFNTQSNNLNKTHKKQSWIFLSSIVKTRKILKLLIIWINLIIYNEVKS